MTKILSKDDINSNIATWLAFPDELTHEVAVRALIIVHAELELKELEEAKDDAKDWYESQIEDAEGQVSKLEDEIEDLKEEVKSQEGENDRLEKQLAGLQDELDKILKEQEVE